MCDQLQMKPSELKHFLKFEGSYNYSLKRFIDIGHFRASLLLQDSFLNQDVLGKVVCDYNEGEFIRWPHLNHENVITLLDMVPLSHQKSIFIFTFLEKTLRTVIREASFSFHPKCFERKRSYAKDVLSGLEYLHQKSLSLMNLDDCNVLICSQTDKAVISDLSCCWSTKTAFKTNCPVMIFNLFPPPEVGVDGEFECTPFDMWNCGVMFLQMFTKHLLPWCQVLQLDYLEGLTNELLRQSNPGSNLQDDTVDNLKTFLAPFLEKNPNLRITAKNALESQFLQSSGKRIDEEARDFWKACETKKSSSDWKFGKVYHGFRDIYCDRKHPNSMIASMICNLPDTKLKKSKSSNELYAIARESTAEVTFKNISSESNCFRHPLLKRTSYSEEKLRNFYSWPYAKTPVTESFNVVRKADKKELKSGMELNLKSSGSMLKNPKEIDRNLNFEDSSKFYKKERYSEKHIFDLPCRCVFCTGAFEEENPLKLIETWPSNISSISSTDSGECVDPFTEGGFLHNNWISKKSPITRTIIDSIQENSVKRSNDKEKHNSCNLKNITHTELFETLKTSPLIKTKSDLAIRKVYPDNSFTSGENQLMFQRCTGFRNGLKFRTSLSHPLPMPIGKSEGPSSQNKERTSKQIHLVKPHRRVTQAANNAKGDVSCIKKEKTYTNKKDYNKNQSEIYPRVAMETRSGENKVVDISMELPLCSVNREKVISNKTVSRDKPKQKWMRVLCPGSVVEDNIETEDIAKINQI